MFEKTITIYGKHATYLKFLAKKTAELNKGFVGAEIFKRYIDVYIAGIIVGLVKRRKTPEDMSPNGDTAKLFAEQVVGESIRLHTLYRIMWLLDDPDKTPDEKIDLAFRYDSNEEKVAKGMELLNSYACGGIEWLYEKITENATSKSEYLENLINMIKEYSDDYSEVFPNIE